MLFYIILIQTIISFFYITIKIISEDIIKPLKQLEIDVENLLANDQEVDGNSFF